MSWTPSDEEVRGVLSLDMPARYEHWIKRGADREEVWSLAQAGGWALAGADDGRTLIPVWPHAKYATMCAGGAWAGYEPKAIDLDAWLDRWIPGMERDRRLIAVFATPEDRGIAVEPRRLEQDLRRELSNYE